MASLFFPQLSSGALAQYPVKKTRLVRTIRNVLPDGSMLLFHDANASRMVWDLAYTGLQTIDSEALQAHFASCSGPFRAFTFIDPTENMLIWSSDLRSAPWQSTSLIQFEPGLADPDGGASGFTVTNMGQENLAIAQTLVVPTNYQYCFSVYVKSFLPSQIVLTRSGASVQQSISAPIGPKWNRVTSSGALPDSGTSFTVSISLTPGQQVGVYGPQLEPQIMPSRYRPTDAQGGVYANAHWGVEQLTTVGEAPGLCSTSFSIEASIRN